MSFTSLVFSKITLALLVIVCAVGFHDRLNLLYKNLIPLPDGKVAKQSEHKLFTAEQLSLFNGQDNKALYLAVLGVVFDVTKGRKHYEKGAAYNYFVGKDGSRSLITGDFSDISEDCDYVLDLTCDDIFALIKWKDTYRQKYTFKGRLIGRYYDESGSPTPYLQELKNKVKECKINKQDQEKKKEKYPPCNIEWSVSQGTKVWCSKNSGGVTRNWKGVRRHLYTPGEAKPECVCVDNTKDYPDALLKEYSNCQPTFTTCIIENN